MICDKCKNVNGYTLGQDECGAGNYFQYCNKGHWEGCEFPDEKEYNLIKEGKDPWENCNDFCKR